MLKFPYGISNYYRIVTENYFYVDRSSHIRLIEDAGDQLLFLRPRRFGKSLLLSMLENYYDVAKADEFEKLFGHLAIGKNPTPKHNKYLIMKWDFSVVKTHNAIIDIEHSLNNHINNTIKSFADRYQYLFKYQIEIDPNDAISSFESSLIAIQGSGYKLYLLIDEYDNFANEVMMGNTEISNSRYDALISAESSLKTLFKTVKSAASGRGLERVFITGVSPVFMTDITSSYNVAEDIYLDPDFNDLCGFKESEIKKVLTQIVTEPQKQQDALNLMKTFYNGYCFNERVKEFVYNPTLALYFLKHFQKDCEFPRQMLDNNLAMDRGKLSYVSSLLNGESIIFQALNETPALTLFELANRFGVKDMLNASKDTKFTVSLLYYLGILTLNGENKFGELKFTIPNLVVRKLYVERIFEMFLPQTSEQEQVKLIAKRFYQSGDLQPLCDFMEQRYLRVFDNRDYKTANELTIKTAFLTALFDDVFYIMDSEMPAQRRYTDLTMILRPEQRKYPLKDFLFEFKYLKLSEVNFSGEEVKQLSIEKLKNLEAVKEKIAEAETQLLNYQRRLESKYKDLRLQLICVVAVGFERLVVINFQK
jgi:hypothetical protein